MLKLTWRIKTKIIKFRKLLIITWKKIRIVRVLADQPIAAPHSKMEVSLKKRKEIHLSALVNLIQAKVSFLSLKKQKSFYKKKNKSWWQDLNMLDFGFY